MKLYFPINICTSNMIWECSLAATWNYNKNGRLLLQYYRVVMSLKELWRRNVIIIYNNLYKLIKLKGLQCTWWVRGAI